MAKKKKTNITIKTQLLVATGVVLLLTGFGLFVGWLDSTTNMNLTGKTTAASFSDVTLKGASTCLTPVGSGPHTMVCALGVKTSDGTIYAVKGKTLPTDTNPFEVTGTLTPPSSDETYDIAGTLTIK